LAFLSACPNLNCDYTSASYSSTIASLYCCVLCNDPAQQASIADTTQVGPYPIINCAANPTYSVGPPVCSATTPVPTSSILQGCAAYNSKNPQVPTTITITAVYTGLSCAYVTANTAAVNAAVVQDVGLPTAVVQGSSCVVSGATTTTTFTVNVILPSQDAATFFATNYAVPTNTAMASLPPSAQANAGVSIAPDAAASKVTVTPNPATAKKGSAATLAPAMLLVASAFIVSLL